MLLKQVIEARDVLKRLATKSCKPQLAYSIMKILKETADNEDFYVDKYREIMDECAIKDKDGSYKVEKGLFVLKDGCKDKFNEKMTELCSIEVENTGRKLKLSELEESLNLTPNDMYSLDIFIAEEQ